ncbi:MAG: hypothetical protein IJP61_13795 [Treponema sp.]|nr:hypothetical protein [Treponema sp.]
MTKKLFLVKAFFLLFFFIFLNPLFPVGGNIFHGKKLSLIKTEYFDIIFSDDCIVSAKKIAAVADGYYAEISQRLGVAPYMRFPVVITREVESPNGFFSPVPFGTIVLYETIFNNPLDTFPKTIEAVFYHELTHAVTLNDKSPFWRGMSFFGDFANPAYLSASYFWLEGASVLFESTMNSEYEEGRLGNPYFTQLVSQAKTDHVLGKKKFPSWRDVAGARDIFPAGTVRYAFGACFARFLIERYGMESYQAFWHKCGKYTTLSFIAGIFKKSYGVNLDDAWKSFIDWVPCIIDDEAFSDRTLFSESRAVVKALDSFFDKKSGVRRIVWFDSRNSRVMIKDGGESKKLFSATGIVRLSFSEDGSKIAVTRSTSRETPKSEAGIYDLRKRTYSPAQKKGAAEAFFRDGALDFISIKNQIDEDVFIQSPLSVRLDSGAELYACIEKRGLDWKIRVGDSSFSIGDKRIIQNLHFEQENSESVSFCFSWADIIGLEGVSKIGRIVVNLSDFSAHVYLQNKNGFSGFLNVVPSGTAENNTDFFVVAAEYEANPLYKVSFAPDDFDEIELSPFVPTIEEKEQTELLAEAGDFSFSIQPYSRFSYALKGTKLPFSLVPSVSNEFEIEGVAFLGASYLIASPWLNNFFLASGGFDPFEKNGGGLLGLYGFDSSVNYLLLGTLLFNSDGFMQTYEKYSLSAYLFRGLISSFQVGIDGDFFYGSQKDRNITVYESSFTRSGKLVSRKTEVKKHETGVFLKSEAYLQFSNVHKAGPGVNDYLGFFFRPFFDIDYKNFESTLVEKNEKFYSAERKYLNFGGTIGARLPGIPAGPLGTLFPIRLQATLFPSDEYVLSAFANVTLLSVEIQKGIPALSLYATRAVISASYSSYFSHYCYDNFEIKRTFDIIGDLTYSHYSDIATIGACLILNPNTGALADPTLQFSLEALFNYYPNSNDERWSIDLIFGILNFSKRKTFK